MARGLAEFRKSGVCLEQFELNPFLTAFYENPKAHATETEFAFLLIHYHQLKRQRDLLPESEWVADFNLGKDLLYAELNLVNQKVLNAFRTTYSLLLNEVPRPDVLVCLSASTELITKRIRERKREYELQVDGAYFERLNMKYETYFREYRQAKIIVPMDEWDFVEKPERFRELSARIDELKSKT